MSNEQKPQPTLNKDGDLVYSANVKSSGAAPAAPTRRTVTAERRRPTISDGTVSRFAVDKDRIPDDVEYRWVRIQIKGEDDNDNYDKALINGWLEVPASRHPELVLQRLGQKAADSEGPILRAGHVLMDLPKVVAMEARERQRQENMDRIQSIEHTLIDGAAPTQFFTQKNDVTTSKGVSFQN